MTLDGVLTALPTILCIVAGGVTGYCVARTRHAIQFAHDALEQTEVALDLLGQMEEAHDPGRDVQNRLAAVLEARMIVTGGSTERPPIEARRAAAQAMAAQFIADVRRADLVLSKNNAHDEVAE